MIAHVSYDKDTKEYQFNQRTGKSVTETDYVRLLLQSPFDIDRLNVFLFINHYPITYSESNVKKFSSYLSETEHLCWNDLLNTAFETGRDFKKTLGDFWISGMSIGKAYVITVESKKETQTENIFLQENLKSLGERAKKFKEYCDLIQDPFWIRDKNLNLLFVNQAFLDITTCANMETVIEKKLWLCDNAKANILAQLALQKNDIQTMHVTYVKSGQTLFGSITETPVMDDSGDVFCFGRLYDKTAETELKIRVSHLESGIKEILTNISVAASLFDNHRRLRFYNQAFVNLWHLTPDYLDTAPDHLDILDKLRAERLIPESRDYKLWRHEIFAPYHDLKAHYEDIWHTPQQKTIKCSVSAYSDGGVVCLQEDVTDYIALEQSHHIITHNLSNTLNALDEGIILCDSYGKIKVINTKIADIFKNTIHLNTHLAVLLDNSGGNDSLICFIEKIYSFIQNGFPDTEKYTQECLVDESIFIASVERLSTGDILIHLRDHTAMLNYQKMLHYKTEMLRENEHIRESFFRRISHNLRDPMTAVAGFAELLQTEIFGTLNPKQREYIADMRYSIDDLLRLTDNLADLVRLDTNALTGFETISLRTPLMTAIESMQNEAFSRNITLKRTIDDDVTLHGDSALLKQSLIQLLENAIMVTPRGGVVTVNLIIENTHATIQIIDQGNGMPAPLVTAIENQNINAITGYGLRYVLRVATLHNALCHANIITDSQEKTCGTCFEVRFDLG